MHTRTGAVAKTAHAAWVTAARRLRAGLAGAALAALAAGVLPAGAALAAAPPPAPASGGHASHQAARPAAHPATTHSTPRPVHRAAPQPVPPGAVAPVTGQLPVPGARAACGAARPGFARCLALVRTNIKTHTGFATAGTAPAGYGPADLQAAYNLPSATAGAGQTVAIVDAYDDPNAATDLATYRAQYGLPPCTTASGCFRKVGQDGSSNYPLPNDGWSMEISLDLDMVSAICPNCRILLVEASSASINDLGAAVNEAVALGAKYVSNSYGQVEGITGTFPDQLARYDALYYNHPGVAVTAGSGDNGYSRVGASYPASSPDVTAVGGTTLTRDTSAARGWDETAWSGGISGTGSGCSASEPKPSWQKDTGCAQRTVADVSAVANPATGVAVYDSYAPPGAATVGAGWNVLGGTSAASPLIASVYALAGTPSPAANPASYPYADPSALNDITSGFTGVCSPAYLCTAGPGYDGPTGLGTPNGTEAFRYGVHGSHGDLAGTVTGAATGKPLAGAQVSAGGFTAVTGPDGRYDLAAVPGTVDVTASAYGYAPKTATGVTVTAGQTQGENFALASVPMETVSGTVTDGSGQKWPLYAKVSVPGTPAVAYTDPATGHYSLQLPAGGSYTLQASPVYQGYQPSSQQVSVGSAALTQDLAVPVDGQAGCTAPGYHTSPVLTENFGSPTVPAGWSVTSNSLDQFGGPLPEDTWYFQPTGGAPNGTGSATYAQAWKAPPSVVGAQPTRADETLTTPVMNLTTDPYPQLDFNSYTNIGAQVTSVDLSTDGGQTWTSVVKSGFGAGGAVLDGHFTIPLPQAAGKPSVQLRFHDFSNFALADSSLDGEYWEVANVNVSDCAPASGGLVIGHVRDANTGQGVAGATITSAGQAGVTTTSMAVPGDPASGQGFYALFSGQAGAQQLTAAANGYTTGTAAPAVSAGQVSVADFTLKAGRLSVPATPVTATAAMGGTTTATVTVRNTGTAPVTLHTDTRPGGFTAAAPAAASGGKAAAPRGGTAAAGFPVQRIRGQFSPRAIRPAVTPAKAPRGASVAPPSWSDTAPWARIADLPIGVGANAGAVDPATGRIYSVGGALDSSGLRVSAGVTMYDPATGQWTALPPMRHVRWKPQAAFIGGKLYVTGGVSNFVSGAPGPMVAATEIYSPASGTWSAGAPVPQAYFDAATAVLNGKMYVIGGCGTISCGQTDVQVYNPVTDRWSKAADYPQPIAFAGCGAIAGKIYCAGGTGNFVSSATRAGYVYDPRASTWTPIADMPAGLWGGASGAGDGKLLISGGVTAGNTVLTNQGYAYDPATNTWSGLPNAPLATYEQGSACGFYQFGGWTIAHDPAVGTGEATAVAAQLPGYGGCGGQDWLSVTSAAVTLAPGQSATIKVTLAATIPAITQPGTYTASLRVGNDTPYAADTIPVTLTVTPPKTFGELTGTVTGRTCAGTTQPLPGATVQITGGRTSQVLTTDANGSYGLQVDTTRNPFTLIASKPGWQAQAAQVTAKAQATTTHDFTLSQTCG